LKLVREHIFEKFEEESDPISDMGIGGYEYLFKNIKEGDEFRMKKNIEYGSRNSSRKIRKIYKPGNIVEIKKVIQNPVSIDDHFLFRYKIKTPDKRKILKDSGNSKWGWSFRYFKKCFEPINIDENLTEKFKEESDPIRDMGIGLFVKRNFKSRYEMHKFLADNLVGILGTKELPKDILNSPGNDGWYIKKEYNKKLNDYIEKYITVDTQYDFRTVFFPSSFHDFLHKYFYPELKSWKYEEKGIYGNKKSNFSLPDYMLKDPNRKVHERFEEKSDPIRDMGIGELYTEKHFDTIVEAADYLIDIIPALFKVKNAYDILSPKKYKMFRDKYYRDLGDYMNKYIFVNNYHIISMSLENILAKKLKKLKEKKK